MFNNSVDQTKSALKDISIAAGAYYNDLKEQGFSDEQAFKLVVEWHKAIMGGVNQP